ncbi:MAG: lipid-A-disaccharide synthase, partial [Planctomycetota bacterium]
MKATASLLAELGRALGDLLLAPPRLAGQFLSRRRRQREFQALAFDPPPGPVSSSPSAGRLRRVLLSCGDASGEIHALRLLHALQRRHPGIEVAGFGGRRLEQAGMRVWQPLADLNVMGFADVVAELPLFLGCVRRFARELESRPPDAVVLVDYPGLNRSLLRLAARRTIPVVDFIAPQLWAWAPWRVRDFRRADRLLTVLPFEGAWYRARGARPLYLGHPLGDTLADPPEEAAPPPMAEDAWWVGILPGSRRREVEHNLPGILQAAALLQQQHPRVRFVLPHLRTDLWPRLEYHLGRSPVEVVRARGCFHTVLPRLRSAWVASGTALLETAAHGVPP